MSAAVTTDSSDKKTAKKESAKKTKKAKEPAPAASAPAAAPSGSTESSAAAPTKGAGKSGKASNSKRKQKRRTETYSSYLYKVLKQVHPETGISRRAMSIMNSLINDTFERLATEAGRLCRYNKKVTLSSREIQTALRLVFPGELAKHAAVEGTSKCVFLMRRPSCAS